MLQFEGVILSMSEKDLKSFHYNKVAKIKSFIGDNWSGSQTAYEAYVYLFENALDDVRKDFLTDITYYRNAHGKQVPLENDLDLVKSMAMRCGLKPDRVLPHLMNFMGLLESRWLIDVPQWDLEDRLKILCFSIDVQNLSKACFYEHLLAWGAGLFARAKDNYKQNQVMILRGNQGIGKDFFIKTLLKGLGPYYGVWTNSRDEREIIMLMERSLVLNIPEFDNTHQNEIAMLKGLITKYQATFRSPYARKAQSVDLRTSFISSANCEYLLRDGTGNRRYLIFVLEKFGLMDKFDEFDSLQILAQFKHAYEVGFKVSREHRLSSDVYIESQTPQPIEEQIFEFWNAEVKDYLRLTQNRQGEWVPAHSVNHIFSKIKKEFGFGRNHTSILLQNRDCKTRKSSGIYYRCAPSLGVAQSLKITD